MQRFYAIPMVTTAQINILRTLSEPKTIKKIAQELGKNSSTISRHIRTLESLNLVKTQIKTIFKLVELTNRGQRTVALFSKGVEKAEHKLRLHDLRFQSKIIKAPEHLRTELRANNWIEADHRTWKGYRNHIENWLIEFTPKSVLFILRKPIYASTPAEAHSIAINELYEVKKSLELNHSGLILGQPTKIAIITRQHLAKLNDPIAIEAKKQRFSGESKTGRFAIDASLGTPELETIHKSKNINDMQAYLDFCEDLGDLGSPFRYTDKLTKKLTEKLEIEILRKMLFSLSKGGK